MVGQFDDDVNHGAFQVIDICVRGGSRGLRQKHSHHAGHRDTKHAHDASPAANIQHTQQHSPDNSNTHIVIDTQTLTHIVTHSQTMKHMRIWTDTQRQSAHITVHLCIVPGTQMQNTHIMALPRTTKFTHIVSRTQCAVMCTSLWTSGVARWMWRAVLQMYFRMEKCASGLTLSCISRFEHVSLRRWSVELWWQKHRKNVHNVQQYMPHTIIHRAEIIIFQIVNFISLLFFFFANSSD